jgi:hypothetical protein
MHQRVSVRRFVVPALLAGLTLCGSLGWSAPASARDPAGRLAVTATHAAPAARAAHPTMSRVPVRSTPSRSTTATSTLPTKTVAVHFTPGDKPPPNGSMLALSKL